jgi:L-ascorbate metabolism protein UlaG (beta-lactamase superfamily)
MKIHHLRNATCIIESGNKYILIDPMLGDPGSLPPFSRKRFTEKRNPLVPLPAISSELLEKVTHSIITHVTKFGLSSLEHSDHLDRAGVFFLKRKNIPVICRRGDFNYLKKLGLNITNVVDFWKENEFSGGTISAVPAIHGRGFITLIMANGAGYFLRLPNEPSLYISGDTVYTKDVEKVLIEYKPDIAVMAAGSAQLDIGKPILMQMNELAMFAEKSQRYVIANHLEALNHCPTSRTELQNRLKKDGLISKVWIPDDGESKEYRR